MLPWTIEVFLLCTLEPGSYRLASMDYRACSYSEMLVCKLEPGSYRLASMDYRACSYSEMLVCKLEPGAIG